MMTGMKGCFLPWWEWGGEEPAACHQAGVRSEGTCLLSFKTRDQSHY